MPLKANASRKLWIHQGLSAEKMAAKWQFSKDHLNHFAYESHRRALAAIEHLRQEIMPVHLTQEDGIIIVT
ncbi:Acetyl-CoA acetyltransferase OS=Lysinibacillus sphaericus OX=1421 GN=LS41612_15565 PE=3 SV=1 [Lysinibacillus sphaericus]